MPCPVPGRTLEAWEDVTTIPGEDACFDLAGRFEACGVLGTVCAVDGQLDTVTPHLV